MILSTYHIVNFNTLSVTLLQQPHEFNDHTSFVIWSRSTLHLWYAAKKSRKIVLAHPFNKQGIVTSSNLKTECPYDAFRRRLRPSTALVSDNPFLPAAKLESLDAEREADSWSLEALPTPASDADLGTDWWLSSDRSSSKTSSWSCSNPGNAD